MADLLLSPPKPISAESVQAAIEAARRRAQADDVAALNIELREVEAAQAAEEVKRVDEKGVELTKVGDEWLHPEEYARRKRLEEEAEERKRKRGLPDEEARRAAERIRRAKKEGEDLVLGFSVKDEKILENRDMLRRRLFPVGFKQWAKNVQEVNVTAVRIVVYDLVFLINSYIMRSDVDTDIPRTGSRVLPRFRSFRTRLLQSDGRNEFSIPTVPSSWICNLRDCLLSLPHESYPWLSGGKPCGKLGNIQRSHNAG